MLVLGAAGGVGLAAVELGKAKGARVIAAVSSEEKAAGGARGRGRRGDRSIRAGPFDRDGQKALAEQFKDAVGPGGRGRDLRSGRRRLCRAGAARIGWEGRYLVVGFPAGIPKLPLNLTLLKSCDVCGVFWGAFATRDPEGQCGACRDPVSAVGRRQDRPRISADLSARARRGGDRGAGRAQGDRQAGGDAGLIAASLLSARARQKGHPMNTVRRPRARFRGQIRA